MSGDAPDPAPATRHDPSPILVWNGLVTRMRRSGGDGQDRELTPSTGEREGDDRPEDSDGLLRTA